jgi:hypothetical protein
MLEATSCKEKKAVKLPQRMDSPDWRCHQGTKQVSEESSRTERQSANIGEGQNCEWPPAMDRNFCAVLELNYTGASE